MRSSREMELGAGVVNKGQDNISPKEESEAGARN